MITCYERDFGLVRGAVADGKKKIKICRDGIFVIDSAVASVPSRYRAPRIHVASSRAVDSPDAVQHDFVVTTQSDHAATVVDSCITTARRRSRGSDRDRCKRRLKLDFVVTAELQRVVKRTQRFCRTHGHRPIT